jgi:hypothetical protein
MIKCTLFYIILGFSQSHSKPNFNVYLKPIIKQLLELENGIQLQLTSNLTQRLKFFAIIGVFDKPARRDILNVVGSTGFFGCLKCLQPGETLETTKG